LPDAQIDGSIHDGRPLRRRSGRPKDAGTP
jgi:hypothetical protein